MAVTRLQAKSHAGNRARGLALWNRARQLSSEGVAKKDAAQRLGLSDAGLNTMLYKRCRSQRWPIAKEFL